jgi:plasmid stability protein
LPAITIRNLPEPVHDALRRIAAERRMSVEALARAALADLARQAHTGGSISASSRTTGRPLA